MKTRLPFTVLALLFLLIIDSVSLLSQSASKGTLRGQVFDAATKEGLPSATVMVEGTRIGATADIDGRYVVSNIDVGRQQIRFSYLGYVTKTIEVDIVPDQAKRLDVGLEISSVRLEEVVITAQRRGQLDAVNRQVSASTIKNLVAADRLQENPDANIAEALGRLPGISLNRSGGEGTGIVLRGLDPKYNKVYIDGIALPSTNATTRGTDISGISQYILHGAEVSKAITADREADATAGAINMQLGSAPENLEGMKLTVLGQGGYNHLNQYWKNYRFQVLASDRFFDKALGVLLNATSESVNRSTQTMSAGYAIESATSTPGQMQPMYVTSIGLGDQYRRNLRNSATLILDYRVSSSSKITFSNLFSDFSTDLRSVSKSYGLTNGGIGYSFSENLGSKSDLFLSSLKSENKLSFLELNTGVAYSQTHAYSPYSRGWSFNYPNGVPAAYRDLASRRLPLETLVNLVRDSIQNTALERVNLSNISLTQQDNIDRKVDTYIDFKIPVSISSSISGDVKFGAKYKNGYKSRFYNPQSPYYIPSTFGNYAASKLPWIHNKNGIMSALGFQDHVQNGILNDQFYFGWYPNFNRLNEFWEFYVNTSNYYKANPNDPTKPFPDIKTEFTPDYNQRQRSNYRFNEEYLGVYVMSEMNFGDFITFTPGVRYEKVSDKMWGWYTLSIPDNTEEYGHATSDTHSDEFFLPNLHLKLRPTDWMNLLIEYTNTLNRPDNYSLAPIVFITTDTQPQTLVMGNPSLKPEFWTNLDIQVSIFGNEIGFFGVSGFYKEVRDMIWTPLKVRPPGDPPIPGFEGTFGSNALVNITQPSNHDFRVLIRGIEAEWQTNFWYLPQPFTHISLNVNYTLLASSTRYPRAETINTQVGTDSRGRPIYKLITTYYVDSGSMVNQPDNIANCSIGYNAGGLNVWVSYSFSGKKLASFSQQLERNNYTSSYSRYDLQIAQKLPIEGMEVIFNLANINNPTEISQFRGDSRPVSLAAYGWTADFGLRFQF